MITVIGAGSLGKNLVDMLCNKTDDQIVVIDGDNVNTHNVAFDKQYVGVNKAIACSKQHKNKVLPITEYLNNKEIPIYLKELLDKSTTTFDCRDTFEDRTSFEAIKLYINKNNLIADFRKKIKFRFPFEGDYVTYINNAHIKLVLNKFMQFFLNKKNEIKKLKNRDRAIAFNHIGCVDELVLSDTIDYKMLKMVQDKCNSGNITNVKFEIWDGPYIIHNEIFDLKEFCGEDIVAKLNFETQHFPAIYLSPIIKRDTMIVKIHNQTGGA